MRVLRPPGAARARVTADSPGNYLEFYGLSKPPFGRTHESEDYIHFGYHGLEFQSLMEHVLNGSGIVLLQGEEGIGKTDTLHSVAAAAAGSGLHTIVISRPPNGCINLAQLRSALAGKPDAVDAATDDIIGGFLAPPRKALLVDDIDLMPADCLRLLVALGRRLPNDPTTPAIVLSALASQPAEASRPDLSHLMRLSRDIVELPRLKPVEIQQYIERSLWIAGGAARRLIAPDAMKLLIARSAGALGITNRLMEEALIAGFSQGDPVITAKTIATAVAPAAPSPRHHEPEPEDKPGSTMQLAAVGLLMLGVAAFLYRGLSDQSDTVPTRPPAPVVSAPSPPLRLPQQPPPAEPMQKMPPELLAALMKRGDQAISLGDIAAARLLYQRAAEAGSAPASTALGKTFDPGFVVPGSKPDPARAIEQYQKAAALGDGQAAELLRRLKAR